MANRMLGALIAAAAVFVSAGCADGGAAGTAGGADASWAPERASLPAEVSTVGTVLEGDDGPELCLGPIADSYPPQCSGPGVIDWDWTTVDGEETASGVTWGDYAIRGDWDGEKFTVSAGTVVAAPQDAMVDPSGPLDPHAPCSASESGPVLPELRDAVPDIVGVSHWLASGCIVVQVEYDDGTLQAAVDERFGEGAIVIDSSFTPVDEE